MIPSRRRPPPGIRSPATPLCSGPTTASQGCGDAEPPGPSLWGRSHPGAPFSARARDASSLKTPQAHLGGPAVSPHLRLGTRRRPPQAAPAPPPTRTPAALPPLPETSLPSKGGGKPWAFRSDWSPPTLRGESAIGCWALSVVEARAFAGEAQQGSGASAAAAAARAGAAGRARAPPLPLPPTPPCCPRCRSGSRPPGRGSRENRALGGGGGGEVMLAPGIRAAAAEQQRLWDPSCSVPLARGPAELQETTRSAGRSGLPLPVWLPEPLMSPLGLGGSLCPGHPDKGVWDRDSESRPTAKLMPAPVPLQFVRSPLLANRL